MTDLMKKLRTTHELEVVVRLKPKGSGRLANDEIYSKDEGGVIGSIQDSESFHNKTKYLKFLRKKKRLLAKSKKLLNSLRMDLLKEIREVTNDIKKYK